MKVPTGNYSKTKRGIVEQRSTADLVDAYRDSGRIQSCNVQFRQLGRKKAFSGPIRTIKTFEDNVVVKRILSEPGGGQILVIDGGGSLRTALVGDVIAALAVTSGWAGIVIHGAVRDATALMEMEIGIRALGTNPWRSDRNGFGSVDVPLRFGDAAFQPGQWVYSDEDGLLVATGELG